MIGIAAATGYLGNNLYSAFVREDYEVMGTYNSSFSKNDGLVHFNLLQADYRVFPKLSHLIISTLPYRKLDEYAEHYEEAYDTCVTGVKKLIDYCVGQGIVPIYLSSDVVFDGEKGNYSEEDKLHALNHYGAMKVKVEEYLRDSCPLHLILRMGRVFGIAEGDETVLTLTYHELVNGKNIKYIDDMHFSPMFIDDIYIAIKTCIDQKKSGTFHLASIFSTSRREIAQSIVEYFKLDCEVKSIHLNEIQFREKRPRNCTLNTSKAKKELGMKLHDLKYYLQKMQQNSGVIN